MTVIPKYLTSVLTLMLPIEQAGCSCKARISHLLIFSITPDALENVLIESSAVTIWFSFLRTKLYHLQTELL